MERFAVRALCIFADPLLPGVIVGPCLTLEARGAETAGKNPAHLFIKVFRAITQELIHKHV
ncbi:MAG TPA: hypothetical protein VG248_17680 [Caulobacteraceae bacterium]|nr:hypothetical protein [Caulobacteraceae bacterium]